MYISLEQASYIYIYIYIYISQFELNAMFCTDVLHEFSLHIFPLVYSLEACRFVSRYNSIYTYLGRVIKIIDETYVNINRMKIITNNTNIET